MANDSLMGFNNCWFTTPLIRWTVYIALGIFSIHDLLDFGCMRAKVTGCHVFASLAYDLSNLTEMNLFCVEQ
jgi:hypothetical protein